MLYLVVYYFATKTDYCMLIIKKYFKANIYQNHKDNIFDIICWNIQHTLAKKQAASKTVNNEEYLDTSNLTKIKVNN